MALLPPRASGERRPRLLLVAACALLLSLGGARAVAGRSRGKATVEARAGAASASAAAASAASRQSRRARLFRRASATLDDPLSTQDASIDLDTTAGHEDDVDMTYVDAASGDEMASPRQQQQPRDLPSPIAIEGTMMAMRAWALF